jgi:hypothetical protein
MDLFYHESAKIRKYEIYFFVFSVFRVFVVILQVDLLGFGSR